MYAVEEPLLHQILEKLVKQTMSLMLIRVNEF